MRRQNHHAVAIHVHERHHDQIMTGEVPAVMLAARGTGISLGSVASRHCPSGESAPLVAVRQRSLITVVAIGDDQLLIPHSRRQQAQSGGRADSPKLVNDTVLVSDLDVGRASDFQQPLNLACGVAV